MLYVTVSEGDSAASSSIKGGQRNKQLLLQKTALRRFKNINPGLNCRETAVYMQKEHINMFKYGCIAAIFRSMEDEVTTVCL